MGGERWARGDGAAGTRAASMCSCASLPTCLPVFSSLRRWEQQAAATAEAHARALADLTASHARELAAERVRFGFSFVLLLHDGCRQLPACRPYALHPPSPPPSAGPLRRAVSGARRRRARGGRGAAADGGGRRSRGGRAQGAVRVASQGCFARCACCACCCARCTCSLPDRPPTDPPLLSSITPSCSREQLPPRAGGRGRRQPAAQGRERAAAQALRRAAEGDRGGQGRAAVRDREAAAGMVRGREAGCIQPSVHPLCSPLLCSTADGEKRSLGATIEGLRRDVAALQRDVLGRDDALAEKERRILDLKHKAQVGCRALRLRCCCCVSGCHQLAGLFVAACTRCPRSISIPYRLARSWRSSSLCSSTRSASCARSWSPRKRSWGACARASRCALVCALSLPALVD